MCIRKKKTSDTDYISRAALKKAFQETEESCYPDERDFLGYGDIYDVIDRVPAADVRRNEP